MKLLFHSYLKVERDALTSPTTLRKIDKQIIASRGEILFARVLLLFEGETEEQALPDFAEGFWKEHPNDLSLAMIGVGGYAGYGVFLKFAKRFRIPWFILSDAESLMPFRKPEQDLKGGPDRSREQTAIPRSFSCLPGLNFEKYLVTDEVKDILKKLVIRSKSNFDRTRNEVAI